MSIHQDLADRHADRVESLLRDRPEGLTDFELAEELGMYLSSVNAARNFLYREGRVVKTDRKRPSGRGGMATVWAPA